MQEMNNEELEAVDGGATSKVTLKKDLSKYFFYPENSVKKTGTKLESKADTKTLRKHLADVTNGQKITRLNSKTYTFFQSGKNHNMMYVKLPTNGAKGYINENAQANDTFKFSDYAN